MAGVRHLPWYVGCLRPRLPFPVYQQVLQTMEEYAPGGSSPPEYLYTALVCRSGPDRIYLRRRCQCASPFDLDAPTLLANWTEGQLPGELDGPPLLIDPAQAFPRYEPTFLRAPDDLRPYFIKNPSLLFYMDPVNRVERCTYIKSETLALEHMLRVGSHDNIVKYHGCVVEGDRVVALALGEVENNLARLCDQPKRPLDVDKVVRGVRAALDHLHRLQWYHNDVNPQNIQVASDGTAVLIDVDSCLPEGEDLAKGTLRGWGLPGCKKSCKENDLYGLRRVEIHLRDVLAAVNLEAQKGQPDNSLFAIEVGSSS